MSDEVAKTKSELIEKLMFTALPILLSCVAYLWTAFNTMEQKITILESKVSVVVTPENKAIPPEGTSVILEELKANAAAHRAELDKRIALLEQIHGGPLKH